MRKVLFGSGLLAACLASSASAGFLGWAANESQVDNLGIIDVYGMFSSSEDYQVSVFNANISLIGGGPFVHNDAFSAAGGSWNPQVTSNAIDSFVSVGSGGPWGANASTAGDPNFSNFLFAGNGAPVANAGWYDNAPLTKEFATAVELSQNNTGSNLGVFVGRFVINNPQDGIQPRHVVFAAWAGFNTGTGPDAPIWDQEQFDYYKIPTPGALALLGLAGLAGRRRRA